MTHNTECEVLDAYRERVNEIARRFAEGAHGRADAGADEDARALAEDLGWKFIGGGAGRTVFRVSTDMQEGAVEKATHEHPCVIKFAAGAGRFSGESQNRDEIRQFQQFDDAVTQSDPPVVVPIADWDRDEYLWLSMPEAGSGGSPREAEERLGEAGWRCSDLHMDNVGEMHGTSVVLDYGLDCDHMGKPEEIAEEVAEWVDREEAQEIEITGSGSGYTVEWYPPDWLLETDRPREKCRVNVEEDADIRFIGFVFGSYPASGYEEYDPDLLDLAEQVLDDELWMGMRGDVDVRTWEADDELIYKGVAFEIETMHHGPDERLTGDLVADLYDEFQQAVHQEFPGGEIREIPDTAKLVWPGQHVEPREGMVIRGWPEFINEVTIVDVHDDGFTVEDTNGNEIPVNDPVGVPPPTAAMVIGDRDPGQQSLDDFAATGSSVRETLSNAITAGTTQPPDVDGMNAHDVEDFLDANLSNVIYFYPPANYDGEIGKAKSVPEEHVLYETPDGEEYWASPGVVAENAIGVMEPEEWGVHEDVESAIDRELSAMLDDD